MITFESYGNSSLFGQLVTRRAPHDNLIYYSLILAYVTFSFNEEPNFPLGRHRGRLPRGTDLASTLHGDKKFATQFRPQDTYNKAQADKSILYATCITTMNECNDAGTVREIDEG